MKHSSGLAAVAALMAGPGGASAEMAYEVTVTNNMEYELLAPILVASGTARTARPACCSHRASR